MAVITTEEFTTHYLRRNERIILIVTAADCETEAIMNRIKPMSQGKLTVRGEINSYHIGILGNYLVAQVQCRTQGSVGVGSIDHTCQSAINELKPLAVVMVGIAYGASMKAGARGKTTQRIGDVLVSERVRPYEKIKIKGKTRPVLEDRNESIVPSGQMYNLFAAYSNEELGYGVHCGPILSGNILLNNRSFKKWLLETFRVNTGDAVGGDMEMSGLANTCNSFGVSHWIMIKGICDWGMEKDRNKERRQRLASKNAVDYCLHVFESDMAVIGATKYRPNKDVTPKQVNKHFLFFYRNANTLSIRKLATKAKVDSSQLMKGESKESDELIVKRYQYELMKKSLHCGEELSMEVAPDYIVEFYNKYKGKHHFYPTKNAKMVFFDFDGTLTVDGENEEHRSTWQKIWLELGYTLDDCARLYRKFINGDYGSNKTKAHQAWCDETAEMFQKKNMTRNTLMKIAERYHMMDNALETIRFLKDQGIKCYIVSGSIEDVIHQVIGEENIKLFDGIACNRMEFDKEGYLKRIEGTKYDFKGKATYILEQSRKEGIKTSDCLFVGNSDNDEEAYKSGAKTLVVNPSNISGGDRNVWNFIVKSVRDFKELLSFIVPETRGFEES